MKYKIPIIVSLILIVAVFIYLYFIKNNKVDMILINGNIYTLDNSQPKAEAIAVRNDKIEAVGKSEEILKNYKTENVIDLKGKTVIPGFIDSHAHMFGLGQMLNSLMLVGVTSERDIAMMVKEKSETVNPDEWIYGRGWDQMLWDSKQFPTKEILDSAAPKNPVILGRIDGHAIWVNQRAMDIAKINRDTPDPPGGKIFRDLYGHPTGIFIDKAEELIEKVVPLPSDAEVEKSLLLAADECLKAGITEVHDFGLNLQIIKIYKKLADENRLPIRIYGAIDAPSESWDKLYQNGPILNYGNGMLNVKAVKMYADGALGSRGAALIENYFDDPGNRGLTILSEDEMEAIAKQAIENNFQVCVHAIGDRANHIVLNVYEKVLASTMKSDLRLRIEHAQIITPEDIPRFKELNVIPSMQPIHATSDMLWAEERLGPERIKGAYAWRSLLKTGIIIPAGSDFPNDIMQPIWGFYAATTRKDHNGKPELGWYSEQCMTREEALKAFTTWGAFASFKEKEKGTIEPGKYADITILSQDIMTIQTNEILETEVVMTIIGGKILYSK